MGEMSPGQQAVIPYILLKDAPRFLAFVKQVFDATEYHIMMRDDKIIQHGEVSIRGSQIMFADAIEDWPAQPASLFIYVDDADESYARAIKAGAETIQELSDKEYGRTCGIKDPCGNTWWITSISLSPPKA